MNKIPCNLIEDLLPLYIEDDVSNETKEIIETHLNECENCNSLLQEYSKEEIKIDSFEDTLPNPNTFKQLIKRLKKWSIAIIAIVLTIFIAIGTIGYKIGENSKNKLLTLKSIVKTFKDQGIILSKDNSPIDDEDYIGGIKPTVYSVDNTSDKLLIYIFDSFVIRQNLVDKDIKNDYIPSLKSISYKANNSFLVYKPSKIPEAEDEITSLLKTLNLIDDTVFKYLNDGKILNFTGESENWEGTFKVKYYENWFEDENGVSHYDSYKNTYPSLKYKNADITNISELTFEYEAGSQKGSSNGATLNNEGYAEPLGISGGTGLALKNTDQIKFTVKWNDKEENFILKSEN
ncbi:zf-HC2 domain-containing protein [Clostridium intestinale]|uniref:Zf-HC2 domain-containing protein n=1 Tax=Clostridium intestinale TaxID=36845 RepID=A0A7D6ZIP0_9CLOT|nr:zf-HC2 domain-containing protein [Clostridium intestinale]QLY81019.1 zf-HC2 domain-containing protein [Clostridium intestinale]